MNKQDLQSVPRDAKIAISLSGGLDSVTLLHYVADHVGPENVFAITFDYNQRHDWELLCARWQVEAARIPAENYTVVDVRFMGDIAKNVSAMVKSDVAVPTVEDTIGDPQPASYMPMRNLIFSSLVAGFAEANDCQYVALGIQETDQHGYWDTTTEFVDALQGVLDLNRKNAIQLLTPFVKMSKTDEITIGTRLGVDYSKTWTCYNGPHFADGTMLAKASESQKRRLDVQGFTPYACGRCSSCADRRTAFRKAGLEDPIPYLSDAVAKEIYG